MIFNEDILLSSPIEDLGVWTFDEQVAKVFQNMVRRSIPGYSNIIFMIGMLAKYFVQSNTQIYDLGCALGETIISIHQNISKKNCKILAIDNSYSMIKYCSQYVNFYKEKIFVDIINEDIRNVDIRNASMVVLNFTLQFLPYDDKQKILDNVYKGLNHNGILILSEKFSFENKKINKLLFNIHHDFKKINGYSELEIYQKCIMLENAMFIDSLETHKARLKKAGFSHRELLFQYLNFGSLIGIK